MAGATRAAAPWTGGFVRGALGVEVSTDAASLLPVEELVGLALRRNPKRAHLLVSTVLAKHVPTKPALAIAAGELLGLVVADAITSPSAPVRPAVEAAAAELRACLASGNDDDGRTGRLLATLDALKTSLPDAVAIGYAETATGLGRLVAGALGSYYIHSTRHDPPGAVPFAAFEEGHSHATSHRLLPSDPVWLARRGPVVLVDDELSTGSTVINTIRELHALVPHEAYIVAALIDLRTGADRARFDALAAELGTRIQVVALGVGAIALAPDILDQAQRLIAALPAAPVALLAAPEPPAEPGTVSFLEVPETLVAPLRSDRFGNTAGSGSGPDSTEAAAAVAALAAAHLPDGRTGDVLVLGTEEFIHFPLAVAHQLDVHRAATGTGPESGAPGTLFSTSTRSPIVAMDRPDYAIAGAVSFASHDTTEDGPGIRYAYNVFGSGRSFDAIIVLPEPGTNPALLTGEGSLTAALSPHTRAVVVVLLPEAPHAAPQRKNPTP